MTAILRWFRATVGLPEGASTAADGVDLLHLFVIGTTMLVALFVFVQIGWFVHRWRRVADDQRTERRVASTRMEVGIAGVVTATFLLWWFLGFRQYAAMTAPPPGALTVYVEAKQWLWKFGYDDGRTTNDTLTVPAGRPVRLVMSSRDVIHSFYVPAFRVKQDVVPGRTVSTWFEAKAPGRYPIWCAEYCGLRHSAMRGEVVVLSEADFAAWKKTGDAGDLAGRGRAIAVRRACLACHSEDGRPLAAGPTWRGLYGAERVLADGRRVVADDAYLTRAMMEPAADVVPGFAAAMPSYRGQLDPGEVGALLGFIRSLAGTSDGGAAR